MEKQQKNYLQNNLVHLRDTLGLSLGYIQKKLNTKSRSTYRHYELGNSEPSSDGLIVLSKIFKVSIDSLIKKDLSGK